jgi:predicted amidohydrolase
MQAVVLQLDLLWHDRNANHAMALDVLGRDPPSPGDLVVLPEAFPVGFTMRIDEVADRDDATGTFLSELARTFGVTVVGGNMIKPDNLGRNIAIVANPDGKIIARYEKLHPFSFSGEHTYYKGGQQIGQFQWSGATVSPMICYDLRFPEAFRIATRNGTQVFVVIANWPSARVKHWLALLTARAIENQAYVIACNRCGSDPHVAYPGRSVIIDPQGNTLVDAGEGPGVIRAQIDMDALHAYRKTFPALNDMRFVPDSLTP